jgi:hypothetical protein
VEAPDPAKGDITLAYFNSDLPQAITQAGITTTFTLDINGHRANAFTGPISDLSLPQNRGDMRYEE